MTIDWRSAVILLITLVLGIVLGALGVGALQSRRLAEVADLRRPAGYVEHLEEVLHPDGPKRDTILALIRASGEHHARIMRGRDSALRAEVEALRSSLDHLLSAEQRARLEAFSRRPPPRGRDGGPPPDGRRGPPPYEGPPPDGRRGPPPDERRGPPPDGGPPPPFGAEPSPRP